MINEHNIFFLASTPVLSTLGLYGPVRKKTAQFVKTQKAMNTKFSGFVI